MKPDPRFIGRSKRFWAHAKLLSEQIGYSLRGASQLRFYTAEEIRALLVRDTLTIDNKVIADVLEYLNWRAETLNRIVEPLFMNREQAAAAFEEVLRKTRPTKTQ